MRKPLLQPPRWSTLALCALLAGALAHARPPNVVLILPDDLGYADISAHGA